MSEPSFPRPIIVTCQRGMPPILAGEIRALGLDVVREHDSAVETVGGMREIYLLNLHIRTGSHVLLRMDSFEARSEDDLYRGVRRLPWEAWFAADGYFTVSASLQTIYARDARFAALRAKDAIVDRMREVTGRRPDSGPDRSRAAVFVHWHTASCRVYIDTSGESLGRRGYRKRPHTAPMPEPLAAACLLAGAWRNNGPFVNPMCGSGTLAIEAALWALHRPPALDRTNFGFMHLKTHDPVLWQHCVSAARANTVRQIKTPVIAGDRDPVAIEAARQNARDAGVEDYIHFETADFRDMQTPPPADHGVVYINPPYGERLNDEHDLEGLYRDIGRFLKTKCQGYTGYVFTGNLPLGKAIGLHPRRRMPMWNGKLECRLLEFEMYAGTKQERLGLK